jgi:uncharacterized protein YdcH (DUF465 family)
VNAIVEITTPEHYIALADRQTEIRNTIDGIEADVVTITAPWRAKISRVSEKVRPIVTSLKQADARCTTLLGDYDAAQERIRQAEEDRLRKEAEAQAKAEQERTARALDRQAEREAKRGNKATARELRQQAESTRTEQVSVSVHVESAVPKTSTAGSFTWEADVFDVRKLIEAVYRGWVEVDALLSNEKYLNKLASGRKEGMNIVNAKTKRLPYPGVRAVKKPYRKRARGAR